MGIFLRSASSAKYYCDTSFLASLYLLDDQSSNSKKWIESVDLPLPLTSLGKLELMGAIEQRIFRKQLSLVEAERCYALIKKNLEMGFYQEFLLDPEVYEKALQIVRQQTAIIGCRTLDVLHVASALSLGISCFVTYDLRQKILAEAVGLSAVIPSRAFLIKL